MPYQTRLLLRTQPKIHRRCCCCRHQMHISKVLECMSHLHWQQWLPRRNQRVYAIFQPRMRQIATLTQVFFHWAHRPVGAPGAVTASSSHIHLRQREGIIRFDLAASAGYFLGRRERQPHIVRAHLSFPTTEIRRGWVDKIVPGRPFPSIGDRSSDLPWLAGRGHVRNGCADREAA